MTKNKRYIFMILLLTLIMTIGFASLAYAAGAGEGVIPAPEGHTPHFPNWYAIGWTAVNFFLLLAVLYKFAFAPINNMLEQRTNTIESSLKHAEQVKVEVEEMRKEAQANLAESRKQAQEIVARATKAAEDAKNEIITKAKEEAENMRQKAYAEIQAATEKAKIELKDAAAMLALMAAEKVLERAITEEDHKNMVAKFINEAGDLMC